MAKQIVPQADTQKTIDKILSIYNALPEAEQRRFYDLTLARSLKNKFLKTFRLEVAS